MSDLSNLPNPDCDFVLKIIMVGNSGVGKSALLKAFMGDPFQSTHTSTIGVDFEIKQVVADGKTVNLQIWDTAGQERFRTITTSYYRSSDAIFLAYDVTDANSFRDLETWLEDIRLYARENVDIMLIGNKVDLNSARKLSYSDAKEYADRQRMPYIETSAKNNVNVDQAFTRITMAACATKAQASEKRSAAQKTTFPESSQGSQSGCC